MIEDGLGGLTVFGSNFSSDEPVPSWSPQLRDDLIVSIDEEGGEISRLHPDGSWHPGAAAVGRHDDAKATRILASGIGAEVRSRGCSMVLAPVADLQLFAENRVIGERSFGSDPSLVGRHVVSTVRGLHDAGVSACVKHFPGHGATVVDSHTSAPTLRLGPDELDQHVRPFLDAVAAGVDAVMVGHLVVEAYGPEVATLNRRLLDRLRDHLDDQLIISDAIDMGALGINPPDAVETAIDAGIDMVCLGPSVVADVVQEVIGRLMRRAEADRGFASRLDEAAQRVNNVLARSPIDELIDPLPVALEVAARSVTVRGPRTDVEIDAVVDLTVATSAAAESASTTVRASLADLQSPQRVATLDGVEQRQIVVAVVDSSPDRARLDQLRRSSKVRIVVETCRPSPEPPADEIWVSTWGAGRSNIRAGLAWIFDRGDDGER